MSLTDKEILAGFRSFDENITRDYFYSYCRHAYNVFDHKYQLRCKTGLDFYSLAHEYYIQLLSQKFSQLEDRPAKTRLSTWMMGGFRFVVLNALKSFNKEFSSSSANACTDEVLEFIRDNNSDNQLMLQISNAVSAHYSDEKMKLLANALFYEGFSQKDLSVQFGITPSAINQRYKKMMDEVVIPFIMENYSKGLITDFCQIAGLPPRPLCGIPVYEDAVGYLKTGAPRPQRVSPDVITSLKNGEIFVFGSNLKGIHAGGASFTALMHFGAEWGNGVGLQGQSYAIPTMQGDIETINPYVEQFTEFAQEHPELRFMVTAIGCGLAGFDPEDIAPLFSNASELNNVWLPKCFWDFIDD